MGMRWSCLAGLENPAHQRDGEVKSKYGAKKITADGIVFDSLAEHRRYQDLKLMQLAGEIQELEVHPMYPLNILGTGGFMGDEPKHICNYVADFQYLRGRLGTWARVTEDVKGIRTGPAWALFRVKAKLFEALYGRPVEVYPPEVKKARKNARTPKA